MLERVRLNCLGGEDLAGGLVLVNSFGIEPPRALPPCLKVNLDDRTPPSRHGVWGFFGESIWCTTPSICCLWMWRLHPKRLVSCRDADRVSSTEVLTKGTTHQWRGMQHGKDFSGI